MRLLFALKESVLYVVFCVLQADVYYSGVTLPHVSRASSPPVPSVSTRIDVLDYVRGIAIIHIIGYHFFLEWFHGSFLILPQGVAANIPRLTLFADSGVIGFMKNLFAFLFAYGFTSVNVFLILSGFVLTWSALKGAKEGRVEGTWSFYFRKTLRIIVPFYVSVILGVLILFGRNLLYPVFSGVPIYTWIDGLKLLFVPFLVFDYRLVQLFNGDYWFIPIILQFYLVFPLLLLGLKKFGARWFLVLSLAFTLIYRFVATYFLDTAPMGVIFPTSHSYYLFSFFLPRLAEFVLGMSMAAEIFFENGISVKLFAYAQRMTGGLIALIVMLGGFALDAYRPGWIFSDFVIGVGVFFWFVFLGYQLATILRASRLLVFLSNGSYETYLLHHYLLNYLLMPFLITRELMQETSLWIMLPVFVVASVLFGAIVNWISVRIFAMVRK